MVIMAIATPTTVNSRIAAIIIIDNNYLFPIKNELHSDIPDAVLNVSSLTLT